MPIARDGAKVFPVSTHGFWKLQGPLAVEGGVTGADRSLQLGLKLPGEADGPLFKIGTQPPESKQIDVLNLFNDGSKENRTGTMTSTTLSGLGLPKDLDFGPTYSSGNPQTFGEPAIFPGGIGYGTVQFVDGTFTTNGAKSTIEVVNLMLGIGNDALDVQGTIDPDVPVKLTGTIIIEVISTGDHPAGLPLDTDGLSHDEQGPDHAGIDLTRPQPFDWKAQGFLVGQPVEITGFPGVTWIVVGFSDDDLTDTTDNTRMHLVQTAGAPVTQVTIDAAPYETTKQLDNLSTTLSGGSLIRHDGGNWLTDGFVVGKRIEIEGVAGFWTVVGMFNDDLDTKFERLALAPVDGVSVLPTNLTPTNRDVRSVARIVTAGDVPVVQIVPITIVGGDYGGYVTRTDGLNWADFGFIEGQLVRIQGIEGSWRLRKIEGPNGSVLRLERGLALPTITTAETRMVYWPGPHGGLTVVHGGGNSQLLINFSLDTDGSTDGMTATVTRQDGGTWIGSGFSVGQRIAVGGTGPITWTIVEIQNGTCPYADPFPGCGLDSKLVLHRTLDGDTAPGTAMPDQTDDPLELPIPVKRSVHVAEAGVVSTTALMNITVQPTGPFGLPTSTLTCAATNPNCFAGVGTGGTVFETGMIVHVSGHPGVFTVVTADPNFLVLQGVALQPTYVIDVNSSAVDKKVFTPILLTVWGEDADRDGGVRIGGDRITVCNLSPDAKEPCRGEDGTEAIAGPNSPLVVYGDTSQDAAWYSGEPFSVKGQEFGPKPFDPFYRVPESQNEDDEWLMPVADPYDFAGNDIIDASGLFSWITCVAGNCLLPTVGFTAYGGEGNDLIIGSQAGDHLAGGSGDDTILGLRGADHIYGDGGVNVDIFTRGLTIEYVNRSPAPSLDPRPIPDTFVEGNDPPIKPGNYTLAPAPALNRDYMEAADDDIHGEGSTSYTVGRTVVTAATVHDADWQTQPSLFVQAAYDDIAFGDHGVIRQQVADTNEPDPRLQKIQTTTIASVRAVESRAFQNGGDDTINGNEGRDLLIGGAGHDLADGDEQDDLLFGDNVFLLRRVVGEAAFPTQTDWNGQVVITSGRFQTLCGNILYSRTDRPTDGCGNPVTADNSGQLLVTGAARDYRDPDSPNGIDHHPWWAEYQVKFDPNAADDDEFHTFDVHAGIKGADSWGNDYLAGGAHHDLVFGQMGHDTLMGDGDVEPAAAGEYHVSASRSPDGCPTVDLAGDNYTHAGTCDLVGDLDLVSSFDGVHDGQDYVEGNGGDDTMFGNLGQDDLVGGSSDFFSLDQPYLRPDGSDRIFGGSGTATSRSNDGGTQAGLPVPTDARGHDADTIVGDNGRIIRIVGTNNCDYLSGCAGGPSAKYVSFIYDDGYGEQIVVRGVTLLDYTPGGPDLHPERFGLDINGPCSDSGVETQGGGCSVPLAVAPGTNTWVYNGHRETAGNDEVHGERGDDTIYLGGGHDIAYGDSEDDDIIGGWGNDWISGGVGQDGVLGDDGRIFTSRNSDRGYTAGTNTIGIGLPSAATNCTGSGAGTCYSEPLYGTTAFQPVGTCPFNHSVLCGDYLDQYIATPGEVQSAVINIRGDLKKTVDLTPYNLQPSGNDNPKFDANNSDDVIFGGLGGERLPNYPLVIGHRNSEDPPFGQERGIAGDFLHGGAGDDAIAGGEAIWNGYTQLYDRATGALLVNAYRTDWTRPFNPGDLLHFGADADAWHDNGPIVTRLGEFALYDEYDPRRTIMLNADGTVNKDNNPGPNVLVWFLNLYSDEGPALNGCISYAPNGTCLATGYRMSDGSDVLFGDEGNDWMVGGTGQDTMYGGWGNDLLNADDVMTVAGVGTFGDQKGRKIQPSPNDVPDTHAFYSDRAYGGAGLDVLIANTGSDRLIDWVGEFNSYIVPFAPFGIATVSRQVPPWLYEFLYALSASHGADPTRDEDQNGLDPELAARNGEPYGELGLITQKDQGLWQSQTGGPSDPQPGNIPGGPRDVKRSADFSDGSLQTFAVDSGLWEVSSGVLTVAAGSLGQDAAAVWYHDQYLPVYFELFGRIRLTKPTAGWKANAYAIIDYFGADDFIFAGLDDASNKLVIGRRTASGWQLLTWGSIPGGVRYDTWYDLLVAVNGTQVTVQVNGAELTYTFGPRMIDGVAYGLNKGLLGFGSDNSRGMFDNVQLRTLPPELTLDRFESFSDGVADWLVAETGAWSVAGQQYGASGGTAVALVDLPQIGYDSFLGLEATVVAASGRDGIAFDYYSDDDFKYVVTNTTTGKVELGHFKGGVWTVDNGGGAVVAGTNYHISLSLLGASISVVVNGQTLFSHGYNAALADGRFGLVTDGTGSFDNVRVQTNDRQFDEVGQGTAEITISDATVVEGNSGTSQVTLTITLSQAVAETVTVQWTTGPGTALAGSDFTAKSGTVTFLSGETSKMIEIDVLGDTVAEPDETFNVTLSNPTGGATIGDGLGVITITNDDALPSVSVSATNGGEGAGSVVVTFTRSGSTAAALVVKVARSGTSVGGDVTGPTATGGTWDGATLLTFADGWATVTLTFGIVDDALVEGDETLVFTIDPNVGVYAIGSPASATATIVDNDAATPQVTVTATGGAEGGAPVTVTFNRTGSTAAGLTVNTQRIGTWSSDLSTAPSVTGGTWNNSTGVLTFNAGSPTVVLTFAVVDDALVEGTETFGINVLAGTGYVPGSPSAANATITDNDAPPAVSVTSTNGGEGGAAVVVTFTRTGSTAAALAVAVSRSGSAGAGDVNPAVVLGGLWNGVDTVTFNVGSSSVTLTYGVIDDPDVEGPETLGFSVLGGAGYTIGSPSATTATISDNDVPSVTVSSTNGAEDGAAVVVTFSRSASNAAALTINAARSGNSVEADFIAPAVVGGSWNAATGTVTFDVGSSTVMITFGVVDDAIAEVTETLIFTVGAGADYVVGSPSSATATITDNDAPPAPAILSINSTSVTESDNGRPKVFVTLTVTRTGNTGIATSANWATQNGTAVAGSDFVGGSGTLSFAANETSKTITIEILADKKGEPNETFTVVLSAPSAGTTISTGTGTVTIVDDDNKLLVSVLPDDGRSADQLPVAGALAELDRAIASWIAAGADPFAFSGIELVLADLSGRALAETVGTTVTLDLDAAGWGWGTIDLFSVLLHEVGHVLGYEHTDTGLMAATIEPGAVLSPDWGTIGFAADVIPVATEVGANVAHHLGVLQPMPQLGVVAVQHAATVQSSHLAHAALSVFASVSRQAVTADAWNGFLSPKLAALTPSIDDGSSTPPMPLGSIPVLLATAALLAVDRRRRQRRQMLTLALQDVSSASRRPI